MTGVKFGVGLFPTEPLHRMLTLVKLSEDMGFSCAYMGDSQMIWREPYVIMGAAAMVTKKITLATGVTNPITRDLGVLAASWVTLRETVGDRVLLGIGAGDSSVETLGKKPSTLANLEQSIGILRDLIGGKTLTWPETGAEVRITYAAGQNPFRSIRRSAARKSIGSPARSATVPSCSSGSIRSSCAPRAPSWRRAPPRPVPH